MRWQRILADPPVRCQIALHSAGRAGIFAAVARPRGRVAELAYAADLGSAPKGCGFESRLVHHDHDFDRALAALRAAGHDIRNDQ